MSKTIFIQGNVCSSKNSKVWTGKFLVSSKQTARYVKLTENQWIINRDLFLQMIEGKQKPYKIHLYFIRDSKREFDYNNVSQILFDLMQKYKWIEKDSAYHVIPVFDGFEVDKQKAGVIIKVK